MNNEKTSMTIVGSDGTEVETNMDQLREAADNMTRLNQLKPGDTISTSDKQFLEAPELKDLATEVIDDKGIELGPAAVCYMLVYPNVSKKRAAKVKKCGKELKYFSGYDYLIQISGDLWDMLDDDTRYKLMWHQLLNLHPVYKAKSQEWVMKKKNPTYTDFYQINKSEGSEWHKVVQSTMGALEDLDPVNEGQVSLF